VGGKKQRHEQQQPAAVLPPELNGMRWDLGH
jgi:hypothetical protein